MQFDFFLQCILSRHERNQELYEQKRHDSSMLTCTHHPQKNQKHFLADFM